LGKAGINVINLERPAGKTVTFNSMEPMENTFKGGGEDEIPKPLGRGSTGRVEPQSLNEKLAMEEAMSNPSAGKPVPMKKGMTDPRWPGDDGWVKYSQNINGTEVHYVYNTKTGQVDDFKFK
jgi:hypothetical protein